MNDIDPQDFKIEYQTAGKTRYVAITGYKGSLGEIALPESINNLPVSAVGEFAFKRYSALRTIVFPESLTAIGEYA
jgi:hypothetical protein